MKSPQTEREPITLWEKIKKFFNYESGGGYQQRDFWETKEFIELVVSQALAQQREEVIEKLKNIVYKDRKTAEINTDAEEVTRKLVWLFNFPDELTSLKGENNGLDKKR